MTRGCAALGLVAMLTCLSVASARGAPASPALDPGAAITAGERALGRVIGDHRLVDTTGAPLSLRDYRGKPLVISLVYSSCSSVCPPTTQHLIDAVNEAGRVFGLGRFAVLTVGFDARNDTVVRMAQFASMQGIKLPNWRTASGDAATIEALLNDLGFSYRAVAGGFDHPTQTTIVDRDGKVYRHVYGDDFPFTMFMEPMKDVVYGTMTPFSFEGLLDRIRFICTAYDPGSRRYRFDYGLVFGGAIAAFSLLAMGGLILREWMRSAQA
ncbi:MULTISPECIES: SCO family protein [unclassified Bradyrhizobium]|uniref:SCO family protein n=1 Tax=unclassified Bradyrhizobium TaxID=2631580 RepID=UPI00188B3413|nr:MULTISPECIES: SCO family protein [unclassified Bradyrhizobium]MDN4984059.1 SCO family protein [Bradyrhizobium sp. WYCCWR 13022]QOZ51768.1 SCO family protein [Bradyrhizobium sp. CCBAU 53338]